VAEKARRIRPTQGATCNEVGLRTAIVPSVAFVDLDRQCYFLFFPLINPVVSIQTRQN